MKKHAIGVDQAAQVPKRWALTKQLGPAPIACFMIKLKKHGFNFLQA